MLGESNRQKKEKRHFLAGESTRQAAGKHCKAGSGCVLRRLLLGAACLAALAGAEHPLPRGPADLQHLAVQAPPAVAALYRHLATPQDQEGMPYEEKALRQIETFLEQSKVPVLLRLRAAETALTAVLHFNLDRPVKDNRQKELSARLQGKLLAVRLQELQVLLEKARQSGDWDQVLTRSNWLLAHYAGQPLVRQAVAAVWEEYGLERFQAGDYRQARSSYEKWEQLGVGGRRLSQLAKLLAGRAQALLAEARQQTDQALALEQLQEALQLWPSLEGLREEWYRRKGTYNILYVGVRQLPEYLSPATAVSDSERLVLDLLFERLVRPVVLSPQQGEIVRPELTTALPEALPGGYRCHLRPDARWSTGQRLTASDVRHTVHLLRTTPGLMESAVWRDLLEPPTIGSDPLQLNISLRQGVFDPLRFLSFPVVPETLERADDPAFAHKPVGSGPYVYVGRQHLHQREEVVFRANPYYRPTTGQPTIREIHFFCWGDHPEAIPLEQPWHLLLDLPAESLIPLSQAGSVELRTLTPRRLFFLALNHHVPALQQLALRRGLALGLDREAILTACFRGVPPAKSPAPPPGQRTLHRALNGPFPPQSWASAPPARVPEQLYDPERAAALLQQLPPKPIHLTLKYPADVPQVAAACRLIAQQWSNLGKRVQRPIEVELLGLSPRELHEALRRRDYQLAYCALDYPSEVFWLWPLFDPHPQALAPGGTNYLQYAHDSQLLSLFHAARRYREFARLREIMQDIHVRLFDQMPFIPLWQLDYHLAFHPDLILPANLDPLQLFADITQWRLKTP